MSSAAAAQLALTAITGAISQVGAQRGAIGASINQLTADTGVESTQVQNLSSAQNSVQNADFAKRRKLEIQAAFSSGKDSSSVIRE